MKFHFVAVLFFAASAPAADQRKAQRDYEAGIRYEQAGQWQQAADAFSAALDAQKSAPSYLHRAKAQLALGLVQRAIDDLTESMRFAPNDPEPFRLRGESFAKLADHRKAVADFTRAIELGTATSPVYSARGASQEQLGLHQLAVDDYSKAIRLRL